MVEDLIMLLRSASTGSDTKSDANLFDAAADLIKRQAEDIAENDAIIDELRDHLTALESERDALLAAAGKEAVAYRGPKKFTPEEIADGNRGIRWVTADGVYGRPSRHDVREYLERTQSMNYCTCDKCKAFYTAPTAALEPVPAASFVLRALVAAGHVSQAKVDEAIAIARKTPGVDAAALENGDGRDAERLDWLDENMFHREMNEWDARIHGGESMWVTFAPKEVQGSARKIIDAALSQKAGEQL